MASEQLFRYPALSKLIRALGAFPKKKFVRDDASLQQVCDLYERGQVVMIFPEGRRTWDGRVFPIRPGIGKLIQRLDARVVFCHIETGHLWQPRWARWPRWVPIEINYQAPIQFPDDWTAEQITQAVQDSITIDPAPKPKGALISFRPAEGLETVLWACPYCFSTRPLKAVGRARRAARCEDCAVSLEVTATNHLLDASNSHPPLHLTQARDRLNERFGNPPVADRARFEQDGLVLQGEQVELGEVGTGSSLKVVGIGNMRLYSDRLELSQGDELLWSMRLSDIHAVAMEMGNVLQLRGANQLLQLAPSSQSTQMWEHFLKPWHQRARG